MRGVAFIVLFGLVACAAGDAVTPASASSELREWQTAAGKPPSKNEFAAVVAACEDRAKSSDKSGPIEGCLADYGLRRVQQPQPARGTGVPDIAIFNPASLGKPLGQYSRIARVRASEFVFIAGQVATNNAGDIGAAGAAYRRLG